MADVKNPLHIIIKEENNEKWAKHYSSLHQILLVGEGDFSFSLSLAHTFGSASNIVATSLDSRELVMKKYKKGRSNLVKLEKLGAYVFHEVDATKMKLHTDLRMWKFDRIVFNFPHAGFHGKEDGAQVIRKHRNLVNGFFSNACGMLRASGEIHVTHKTTAPFSHWRIGELAYQNSLLQISCVDFNKEDFPGYENKRGASVRCDEPFPLGACCTYRFRFSASLKEMTTGLKTLDHLENLSPVLKYSPWSMCSPPPPEVTSKYESPGISDFRLSLTAEQRTSCNRTFDPPHRTHQRVLNTPTGMRLHLNSSEPARPSVNPSTVVNYSLLHGLCCFLLLIVLGVTATGVLMGT